MSSDRTGDKVDGIKTTTVVGNADHIVLHGISDFRVSALNISYA